jgi:hypothetical protein
VIDMISALSVLGRRARLRVGNPSPFEADGASKLMTEAFEDLKIAKPVAELIDRTSLATVYREDEDNLNMTLGASIVLQAAQLAERDRRSDAVIIAAAAARRYARLIRDLPLIERFTENGRFPETSALAPHPPIGGERN